MNVAHSGIGMTSARTRNRLVKRLREQGIRDERVLEQINTVPRHLFVDEALASRAYEDTALPIGQKQTISQPYIVAKMTEAILRDGDCDRVLEVGTGCGYQTSVLSGLVKQVYSIERIQPLYDLARKNLRQLKLFNTTLLYGDGYKGWLARAPFDAIIITAAPEVIPQALLEQLSIGGRMVVPVGPQGRQDLLLITREEEEYVKENLGRASFVPMLTGRTS